MILRSLILSVPFLLAKCYAQNNTSPSEKYEIEFYCAPCGCTDDGKTFRNGGSCPSCDMVLQSRVNGLEDKPVTPFVRRTAAILLFDMADIMDVTGPMSVMEHAGFNVITVAKDKNPKSIGMYNQFIPDFSFEDMPQADVLILPGGGPAENNQDPEIITWVKKQFHRTETLFSVCSGAFFLAEAGLLDDQQATTFASLIPD